MAGCSAMAKAIASGAAPANGCPVGGAAVAEQIGKIMGVDVTSEKKVAFVKCSGDCESTERTYEYSGNHSCLELVYLTGGGDKSCSYGCLGYGSCVDACQFDALSIVNGVAKVNPDNCVACGKCISTCPKHLIELVPAKATCFVECSSKDKGKDVMSVCKKGCIGCKLCERNCEANAITVTDNIAHIDYEKCTGCGACAQKCPKKIIRVNDAKAE